MKAIVLEKAGGVDEFRYQDIDKPTLLPGEVLIRTSAISINPVDYKTRKTDTMLQRFYPGLQSYILGWDISGTIVEIAPGIEGFRVGDEVFGMVNFPGNGSAYAEYVKAPAEQLALKPENISHEAAAAATLAALTAWQALVTNAQIKNGDQVVIHGASGGVGHYATQIARHFGAHVIGISSGKNKDFVLAHGADEHIDYTAVKFEEQVRDADVVFNTVNANLTEPSIAATRPGGKIISIVGGVTPESTAKAKEKNIDLRGILVNSSGHDMKAVADLLASGIITSQIAATYPFEKMGEAHLELEKGRTVGKIIVTI